MAPELLWRCHDARRKTAKDPHPGCTAAGEIPTSSRSRDRGNRGFLRIRSHRGRCACFPRRLVSIGGGESVKAEYGSIFGRHSLVQQPDSSSIAVKIL